MDAYMAYLLDLAVILVFGLMVFIGYKRGVVKSLSRLAGTVAAVIVAFALCGSVASAVFDNYVGPAVESAVQARVEETVSSGEQSLQTTVEALLESLPDSVVNLMENSGVGTVEEILARAEVGSTQDITEVIRSLVMQVVRPVVLVLLRAVSCVVLLLLGLILAALLSSLLDALVSRMPFVKNINSSLGALFGAIEGLAFVLVLVGIIEACVGAGMWGMDQTTLDKTLLTGAIAQINPVGKFFQSVLSVFAE